MEVYSVSYLLSSLFNRVHAPLPVIRIEQKYFDFF